MTADQNNRLTHSTPDGGARMVDVTEKAPTPREAVASGFVKLSPSALEQVREGRGKKGDVLSVAQLAGVMGAKRTSELIPLCHPIVLTDIDLEFDLEDEGVSITARTKAYDRTGVEMEAMTAVAVAALTVYDMVKGVDRDARLERVLLLEKSGGKSGNWRRELEKG
ncbi:MAG TPA: cyclic pyranopterin monophosphate synthase MoaC [Actinomycetota bacterium]|nr:cyclic pyranopterin monophosphate synthase MoaC [Actinomycetota bacterium]